VNLEQSSRGLFEVLALNSGGDWGIPRNVWLDTTNLSPGMHCTVLSYVLV